MSVGSVSKTSMTLRSEMSLRLIELKRCPHNCRFMIVLICKLELHLPEVHSLKEKRQILKKVIARTQNHFALAIAEVGAQDLWQRAEIGFSYVGNDEVKLQKLVDKTIAFIENLHLAEPLSQERESIHL